MAGCIFIPEMILQLPFDTPSKKNSRVTDTRTGRTFPNKKFNDWHKKAAMWVMAKYPRLERFGADTPVTVKMSFTYGTMRRCDSDNKVSSILDLLVDLRVIADDNWTIVRRIEVENSYKKDSPSCTVEIVPHERV